MTKEVYIIERQFTLLCPSLHRCFEYEGLRAQSPKNVGV